MKVIFLDFDGVLNSTTSLRKYGTAERFSNNAVSALNAVLASTKASIVISSNWRCAHSLSEIEADMCAQGIKIHGRIIGHTPIWKTQHGVIKGAYGCRGEEIAAWLQSAPDVTSYVIVDDNNDMGELLPRLVQTDPQHGLQPHHIRQIISTLAAEL